MTTLERIVLASRNPGKHREIAAVLSPLGIRLESLDSSAPVREIVESGATFKENAKLKASAVARATGEWAVADDSGLSVDALDGAPGVKSARYAGDEADYRANNRKLLAEMEGVPEEERGARFVCAVALAKPDGEIALTACGEVEGTITREERGAGGFGYDPLFYYAPFEGTFAEAGVERKNEVSHRARALGELIERMRVIGLIRPAASGVTEV